MTSHPFRFARVLPSLFLAFAPFAAACFEDHVVGEDLVDAGKTETCPGVETCNEPDVPVGCHVGTGSCVDGAYVCPGVVCPDQDGGSSCTAPANETCAEPPIPSGCTLGPSTCVNGVYQCPAVVCPAVDGGGACSGSELCSEPDVRPGCHIGTGSCVNGVYHCPPVICDTDGGSSGGDAGECVDVDVATYSTSCSTASDCILIGSGEICSGGCACPSAPVSASEQSRYDSAISGIHTDACPCPEVGIPACVAGKCTVCPPGKDCGAEDAGGGSFACGPAGLTCDPSTQYCMIQQGGAISPDGGSPVHASCQTIPAACANDTAGAASECACIQTKVGAGSMCTVSNGGDLTLTEDVP